MWPTGKRIHRAGDNIRPAAAAARTMVSHLFMLVLPGKDRQRRTMQPAVHLVKQRVMKSNYRGQLRRF
jgi:hypothetical protein